MHCRGILKEVSGKKRDQLFLYESYLAIIREGTELYAYGTPYSIQKAALWPPSLFTRAFGYSLLNARSMVFATPFAAALNS
jgi:hypothetical protein